VTRLVVTGDFRPGLAQAALRVAAMFGYQEG
jgi:hypothetical protein